MSNKSNREEFSETRKIKIVKIPIPKIKPKLKIQPPIKSKP